MTTVTNTDLIETPTTNLSIMNPIMVDIRMDNNTNKIVLNDLFEMFNIDITKRTYYYVKLKKKYPNLFTQLEILRVNGKGNAVRVIDIPSAIELVWILPGDYATEFRRKSANYVTRMMAGDRSLIDEIEVQNERISPDMQDALLAHVERPELPQVSVIELQNIIERTKESLKSKEEILDNALLQISELKESNGKLVESNGKLKTSNVELDRRNIKLVHQKEKTIELSQEWHNRCGKMMQIHLQPLDAMTADMASELTNTVNTIYENKIEKIENEFQFEMISDRQSQRMRVCEIAMKNMALNFTGSIEDLIDDAVDKYRKEHKTEQMDAIEMLLDKNKKLEETIATYKKNFVEYSVRIAASKKKQEEYQEMDNQNETLTRKLSKMTRNRDEILEKYQDLKQRKRLKKYDIPKPVPVGEVPPTPRVVTKTINEIRKDRIKNLPASRVDQIKYYDNLYHSVLYDDCKPTTTTTTTTSSTGIKIKTPIESKTTVHKPTTPTTTTTSSTGIRIKTPIPIESKTAVRITTTPNLAEECK